MKETFLFCMLALWMTYTFDVKATPPPPQDLLDKATGGDTEAEISVGLHYYNYKDYDSAIIWWKKGAVKENIGALLNLGKTCLELGDKEAKYWYLRAAQQKHPLAYRGLGIYYDKLEDDKMTSVAWLVKAADAGDLYSQRTLGSWFFRNDNYKDALTMYTMAFNTDPDDIDTIIGLAYTHYKMKNFRKTFELMKSGAEKGNSTCQFKLGCLYIYGEGTEVDHSNARYWITKAAENDNAEAQLDLGIHYYEGTIGLEKNLEKAFEWFKKSASNGNPKAQYNVGTFYYNNRDYGEARKWWSIAAANGDEQSLKNLKLLPEE